MIERMIHRGGTGGDDDTGDGAGIMTGIPHELYASELKYRFCILDANLIHYASNLTCHL